MFDALRVNARSRRSCVKPGDARAAPGSAPRYAAAQARARLAAGDYAKADVEAAITELRREGDRLDSWLPTISRVAGLATPPRARAEAAIAESIELLEQLAARAKR